MRVEVDIVLVRLIGMEEKMKSHRAYDDRLTLRRS
jgi:hypothetical protein